MTINMKAGCKVIGRMFIIAGASGRCIQRGSLDRGRRAISTLTISAEVCRDLAYETVD